MQIPDGGGGGGGVLKTRRSQIPAGGSGKGEIQRPPSPAPGRIKLRPMNACNSGKALP